MPRSSSTTVSGINNRGQIVGDTSALGAFLLSGGAYTRIAVPGVASTFAGGINDSGQIVGQYSANNVGHGFVLSGSSYTTLDVPGAIYTFPHGINDSGQIVGHYISPDQRYHGFLFSGDSYTTLDPPGSADTVLGGINDSGEIVGSYFDRSSGVTYGFLATPTPEPSALLLLGVGTLVLLAWAWRQKQGSNEETSERGCSVNATEQLGRVPSLPRQPDKVLTSQGDAAFFRLHTDAELELVGWRGVAGWARARQAGANRSAIGAGIHAVRSRCRPRKAGTPQDAPRQLSSATK